MRIGSGISFQKAPAARALELHFVPGPGDDPNGVTVYERVVGFDEHDEEVLVIEKVNGAEPWDRDVEVLEQWFLCPGCGAWCDWSIGGGCGHNELCDVCWDRATGGGSHA